MAKKTIKKSEWSINSRFPDPWWSRADIAKDIASIYAGLSSHPNSHAYHVAMADIAEIFRYVIQRALDGDSQCGTLLAETLAALSKNRAKLSNANWNFKYVLSDLEPVRIATSKRSALRRLIEKIIDDARSSIAWFLITNEITAPLKGVDPKEIRSLPEFGKSETSIDAWFKIIVYPTLKGMQRTLRDDPEIGQLEKAIQSGSFQVSSLRPLIRQTVARVAKMPRGHFIDISDLSRAFLTYPLT
jgi:hypothetical protein